MAIRSLADRPSPSRARVSTSSSHGQPVCRASRPKPPTGPCSSSCSWVHASSSTPRSWWRCCGPRRPMSRSSSSPTPESFRSPGVSFRPSQEPTSQRPHGRASSALERPERFGPSGWGSVMRGLRLVGATVATAAALLAAGCGSSGTSPPVAARPNTNSTPAYQMAGPNPVGVTTLDLGSAGPVLGERLATVFYPANPATLSNVPQFSYTQASTLPASLQGILPPQFDSTTTINASRDAPGSPSGPYPVVLFSHGFGGERLYYSNLLAGMASWGYVVVSADYLERGLAAQALRLTVRPSASLDRSIMLDSLTAVEKASDDPS